MELRSCSNLHFIQAIKAGLVEKVCNIDSRGRPALVFKKLEDIYASENAKRIDSISKPQSQSRFADMLFDCDKVKTESPCLLLVERKTKERCINMDELNCNSDDNKEGGHIDDFDFGNMTLKQLKEQCKTKKRKVLHTVCSSPKQEYTDWQSREDECDLEEPIIHIWKSKFSKNLKGKRNRAKKCSSSSSPFQTDALVDSKQIPNAEGSLQFGGYLPAPINVKVEVSETESSECINIIHSANDTITGSSELLELKSEEQISLTEERLNCVVNEISYDHLEHIEPTCLLPLSIGGEIMEADNLKKTYQQQVLVLPISDVKGEGYSEHPLCGEEPTDALFPVKCQSSEMCSNSQSYSSVQEISRQANCISGVQAPDMADDDLCCMAHGSAGNPCGFEGDIDETLAPNLEIDSLNCPSSNCSSFQNSNPCSSPDIVLVPMEDDPPSYEKPIILSVSVDAAKNYLSPNKNPVAFGDSSTAVEKKQPLRSGPDNSPESNRHLEVHELALLETKNDPHLEDCHPPERLLSTRKAISPASQEKLCQAMKVVELKEEIDHYKCKEKLQFDKEIKNKASPEGLDAEVVEINLNSEGLTEATRIKVAVSPKPITKKPKTDRKVSPPKVIQRSPCDSYSPPDVRTGATFTQSCSERVIAFSQRQMHDIECLAMKLMEELRSMKDIVEGKLHPEASPTGFLEYDKMKTAINSATKVEETTRKWLSMMAKDCSRFCKLMLLDAQTAPFRCRRRRHRKPTSCAIYAEVFAVLASCTPAVIWRRTRMDWAVGVTASIHIHSQPV